MIFASQIFLQAFLGLVIVLYALTPTKGRSLLLTLASFVFYGWWRPDFLPLMIFSAVVDFIAGARLHAATSDRHRRAWLFVSLTVNLGLLGWFKYADFAIGAWNDTIGSWTGSHSPLLNLLLPVGISFYTFQSMSYTIDIYRREVVPTKSFIDFLCYVTLFPQLVAGPIVRYRDIADQLRSRRHTLEGFARGAWLFQIGFLKKVLIADSVAPLADASFAVDNPSLLTAWVGITAYAFQIYFDFSGYSDMAIGLGRLFGFEFPANFDQPYRSRSITEFWRRWHMSLSTWLRDYLYVPLGGNRKGEIRTYVNLAITMLLGGLWHGAQWTFVAWGAWQGAWLILERLFGKRALWSSFPAWTQVLVTFIVTLGGWVWFRAASIPKALDHFGGMLGLHGLGLTLPDAANRMATTFLLVAALTVWLAPTAEATLRRPRLLPALTTSALFLLAVLHLWFHAYTPFLYFQF